MLTNTVLPNWLDQVQGVDFTPEKELLSNLEQWASKKGWIVSDGSSLPSELRQRTDVLLSEPAQERHLRISVLPKSQRGPGTIRIDAANYRDFSFRTFDLVYLPKQRHWRVEVATVPLTNDIGREGWDWLETLAFSP